MHYQLFSTLTHVVFEVLRSDTKTEGWLQNKHSFKSRNNTSDGICTAGELRQLSNFRTGLNGKNLVRTIFPRRKEIQQ